jgi:hypothetical protein
MGLLMSALLLFCGEQLVNLFAVFFIFFLYIFLDLLMSAGAAARTASARLLGCGEQLVNLFAVLLNLLVNFIDFIIA